MHHQQMQQQMQQQLQQAKEQENNLRKSLQDSQAEAVAAKAEIDRLTEQLKTTSSVATAAAADKNENTTDGIEVSTPPAKNKNTSSDDAEPPLKKRPFALLSSLGPFDLSKLREMLVLRAAKRLHVSGNGAPGIIGEYKLLEGAVVNGRPAWRLAGNTRNAPPFLLWLPREGGSWVFTTELPTRANAGNGDATTTEKKGTLTELVAQGQKDPLARSTQLAWTALPDDLMCTSWTKASWNEPRVQAKVMVVRG
mmetsp:Transcript_51144/g.110868  ORF Transcript_51144/g.110868 Transcript_51144/m.110868 type:complete len:252 (-) Transcript_51144:58-813(-)